jgi:hypothetical protein
MGVSSIYLMFTRYTRWLLTIVLFYAVNTVRWSDEKAVMTLRRSMRPILSLGFEIIYTVVGIMDKMSQSNYMILHEDMIIKLERIETALWMGLGSTQKNVHKLVLPRTIVFLFEVSTTHIPLRIVVSWRMFMSYVSLSQILCIYLSAIVGILGLRVK